MKRHIYRLALFAILAVPTSTRAPILDVKQLSIDFANEEDAKPKAEWSNSDKLTFTAAGLGRERGSWDNDWIQTKPIAVGLSWRPPTGVMIEVKITTAKSARQIRERERDLEFCE